MLTTSCARIRLSSDDQIRKLAEDFVYTSLALAPSAATAQGYHEHQGVVLDDLLEDYSPKGIEGLRVFYNEAHANADHMAKLQLTPELKADLDIVRLQSELSLLDLDRIQSYRHNPTVYVETIGNAINSPFVLNYEPEAKRLAHITARVEKIPAFLETAKRNLIDSPSIWNEVAQGENEGDIGLIDQSVRAKMPKELKTRYDSAASQAIASLKSFNDFLKHDLSNHQSDWRLGEQPYALKFKLSLATGDTPKQALADAETKLESIRADMKAQANALYPKYYPGRTPPAGLNEVVSQVLGKIAQQHAKPEDYFTDAKRDLATTTQFVKDHHLLTLPDQNNLEVIPTPEFMRGIYAVGGFASAPPLEPNLGAFYWITPFTPGMTKDQVESKLREYNRYGLEILTIHEAMPGHYVQAEYANQSQPKWRGLLRSVFSNNPYVEGWAVYATQLMIEEGFDATPEMQLTFGKQMLRVVSNTILDIRLQTMGMTDQQALDLMRNQTFQENEEAIKKLQRAKLSSCQLPTYFVGWRGWQRLRAASQQRSGSKFKLASFHEKALHEGALPLPVLSGVLVP